MNREDGSAVVEFTQVTVLLLVPLLYLVIAVFDAQRAAFGVSAASQAAARAFVQSSDVASAQHRARLAARLALDDHHVTGGTVSITCDPECLQPGSTVRVRVELRQPLPLAPSILGREAASVRVDATHTEPYGSYREGKS